MNKDLVKLRNSFLRNLPWKIAAFLMAFTLWFIISNVEDPMRTDSIPVSLELRNEAALMAGAGIHLENIDNLRNQTIRVTVRGTSSNIDAIRQNIRAYIDLSAPGIIAAAQAGEPLSVDVQPDGYGPIELLSFSPRNVTLIMDTITTIDMTVDVETEGTVADGYFQPPESVSVTPDVVTVTGPTSIVDRIDRLVVTVDTEGAYYAIAQEGLTILAQDAMGATVESAHLRFENSADIEIPIFRRARVQILQPPYSHAQSPPGYGIHSVAWNPGWLDVAGETEAIGNLAPIVLDPIPQGSIENYTTDFTVPYDIRFFLPTGVFLIDPTQHAILVDVFVEPFVEREFVIAIEDVAILGLPANTRVIDEEITITLSALRTIMAAVNNVAPTAFVNSTNLEEGYNEIPIVIPLPARVNLVGEEAPFITIYYEAIDEDEYDYDEDGELEEEEAGD